MRILTTMTLGAALLLGGLGLTPKASAQDYIPAHYETRTIQVQGEGRWVDQEKVFTVPGRWEEFDRQECVPGHYETRCQMVTLPGHYETVQREVSYGRYGCCTISEQIFVAGRRVEQQVQVWVPEATRCVRDRRWIPPTTTTQCVRVWQQGCLETRTVEVYVPAQGSVPTPVYCAPAPVYCAPAPACSPVAGIRIGFGGREGFRFSIGAYGR